MSEVIVQAIKYDELNALSSIDNLQNLLDSICGEIAKRFNLYRDGKARKATIIDILSGSTCVACAYQRLLEKASTKSIDAVYKECHKLAVNILVERLYWLLNRMGYTVAISTEAELKYSKADIIITITSSGINLKHRSEELIIEIKTGSSLSFSQLFRYMLSGKSNSIILWRIRKRQILLFDIDDFKPLLSEFATMIYLRANRLLSSTQITCEHEPRKDYYPTQEELQTAIQEFAQGLQETLPHVLRIIIQKLGLQNKEGEKLDVEQARDERHRVNSE